MNKFEKAYTPESEILRAVEDMLKLFDKERSTVLKTVQLGPLSTRPEVAERIESIIRRDGAECQMWKNDVYTVAVYAHDNKPEEGWPKMIHLSIKRNDRQPIHDWRDLQEIKNQLVGPENEALELYPAEERRVDSANQYHLYVFENPEIRVPFGFCERFVADHVEGSKSQQRPLEKGAS